MTRDRKMTSQDVNALRNGPKWWLYSSLAMAVLVGMGLTETSAQADTTATSTATATTTVQGTPGQQLQADQVTLTTTVNTQASSSEAPVGAATGGDEATDDKENAGAPSTGTGSAAQEAVDRTGDGDASVTEDDVPASTAPAENQSSAAESAVSEKPAEADGTVEGPTQPDSKEVATEPAAAQSPSSTADSTSATSDLEPAEKTKINEEKEVESPQTTAKPARYRAAAAPAMMLDETVNEDLSDRFEDQNLLAAVRKGLGLKEGELLTQAFIQDYKVGILGPDSWPIVDIKMPENSWLTSLAGLEVLADLSSQYAVNLTAYLGETAAAMRQVDFSPLTAVGFQIGDLNLYSPNWGSVSAAQMTILAQMNPVKAHNLEFSSPTNSVINFNGITNAQFAILAPFVAAVLENNYPGSHMVGFAGNNITDFSPLKSVANNSHTSQITGWYQYAQVQQAIAFKPGQTVTVTSPVTGIMGESFNYRVRYYQDDGSENGVLTVAEGQQVTVTAADGTQQLVWQYQLVNPKLINNQLVYGHFNYTDAGRTNYTVDANGQSLQEVTLAAGALVFQPVSDQGKITVHYVDDTTAETLKSDTLTGDLETISAYRTQETLDHYLAAGYVLVSDDYPVDGATFTADEQTFTVHLKHGTKTVDQAKTVTRTIHYRYADGTTAAPDHLSRVTFTQRGTQDLVTSDTVWGDWEATDNPDGFPAQTSPTITGYTADQLEVAAVPDVTVTSADQTVVVTYTVNHLQNVTVTYRDATTGTVLQTETLAGDYGITSDYRTADQIAAYLSQGYELADDDYPVAGVVFSETAQAFTVNLTHGTEALSDQKTVSQTIRYQYRDGTTAAPEVVATVTFARTGTRDKVTGETTWTDWQATENPAGFPATVSPVIAGYLADRAEVAAVTDVTAESADTVITVTYTAKTLNNVTVTYVDATTGQTLKTETLTGDFGTTSDYRTADQIAAYLGQGYELAADDYPVDGVVFGETAQVFTVNLTHGLEALANSKRVTQTIHYRYADGTTAAPDYVAWLTFMRQGTRDKVTGQTQWQDWVTAEGTREFAAKVSPNLTGYTANRSVVAVIPNVTATDADYVTVVTYTAQAVVPPVTPPVTPPTDPDPVPNPDPEPGEQPDQGEAPAEPDELPNDQEGVTPDTVAPKDTDFPVDVITGGQPVTLQAAKAQVVAGKRQETTTRNVAASHPQTAAPTQTRATRLPQTNDQQSPWARLGTLGLSLLGWIGWRKQQ